jgi:hypothetical protein
MLEHFASEMTTATLIPGAAGNYVNGEWTPATDAGVTIKIIIPQPVSANDLNMLEDGEHLRDYKRTYSETQVSPRIGKVESDTIQVDGRDYKVVQVDDRDPRDNFYRIIMRYKDVR